MIVVFSICNRNNYKRKIEKSLRKTDMEVMCPVLERQESIMFCSIDKGEKKTFAIAARGKKHFFF